MILRLLSTSREKESCHVTRNENLFLKGENGIISAVSRLGDGGTGSEEGDGNGKTGAERSGLRIQGSDSAISFQGDREQSLPTFLRT